MLLVQVTYPADTPEVMTRYRDANANADADAIFTLLFVALNSAGETPLCP